MSPARAPRLRRRVRRGLIAVAAAIGVMGIALVVAMFVDDAAIDRHPVRAVATVLTVSPLRTGIEFVAGDGVTIRPAGGVMYPGLLRVGQQFMVEYAADDPETVRVAGRSATNGLALIALTLGLVLATAAAAGLLLAGPERSLGSDARTVG